MTIIFQGHVEKLELGTAHTKVTIRPAMQRMNEPLVVEMSKDESAQYHPGTPVQIQIHPTGKP